MANMMQRGAAMVARAMAAHASHAVLYSRDSAGLSVVIDATVGNLANGLADAEGLVVESTIRDYIVAFASLTDALTQITPQRGDVINDRGHLFEVRPVGDEPVWHWSDRDFGRIRIHTRYIGPAT